MPHDHHLVPPWCGHAQLLGGDTIDPLRISERSHLGAKLIMGLQELAEVLLGSLHPIGKSDDL
jgi:hypothetical protein